MKAYLTQLLQEARDPLQGRHLLREYLQARILGSLQRAGAMIPLAFHGGTALRFLYNLPRYSEDLDFALERPERDYDFRAYLRAIVSDLAAESYTIAVKVSDARVVQSGLLRFPGLLHEMKLSPYANEVFSIKVEVDTRPPAGAGLETTVLRRHTLLHLQHHDRASLLAGKLHALLQRPYAKGRDLYDLVWYLTDPTWPPPNLVMLNNALAQTGWSGPALDESTWRAAVQQRLAELDLSGITADVQPFLMDPAGARLLTRENVGRLLQS